MLVWPTKLIVTCFQTCWLKNMDITVFPFLEIIPLPWDSYPFLNSSLILASGGLFWTYHFFLNVIYGICHKLAFMLIMDFNLSLWLDGRCCQGPCGRLSACTCSRVSCRLKPSSVFIKLQGLLDALLSLCWHLKTTKL